MFFQSPSIDYVRREVLVITERVKNMGTKTVNKFENELRRMIPYKRNTAYAKYFKIEK